MLAPIVRQLLYPAPRFPVPSPPPGPVGEVALELPDGPPAVAWHGESPPRPGAPAALFLHGNGENLETMRQAGTFVQLDRLGLAWLALDYPGYGRSGGVPSEASLVAGATAALDELVRRHPERRLAVCGWSLGAAVAVGLAARRQEELDRVALLSPWTSLAEIARHLFPAPLVSMALGRERYDSLAAAPGLALPTLVVHGERDRLIPVDQGRRVAEALGGPTRWLPIAEAGHNDLLAHQEVWEALAEFLLEGSEAGSRASTD